MKACGLAIVAMVGREDPGYVPESSGYLPLTLDAHKVEHGLRQFLALGLDWKMWLLGSQPGLLGLQFT